MKRIILTTAALALAVLTVSAKPNKKDENKVIDKLKYTITYRTKSVRDTTKLDPAGRYNYENEDMQLEVGEKVSHFYSATYRAYIENLRKSLDGLLSWLPCRKVYLFGRGAWRKIPHHRVFRATKVGHYSR